MAHRLESEEDIRYLSGRGMKGRSPAGHQQKNKVVADPVDREVEGGPGGEAEPVPSQEPVLDEVDKGRQELDHSSLDRDRESWRQKTRQSRNSSERASGGPEGDYAGKSCSRDEYEAGMGKNLGSSFVGDKKGRSWGRNGGDKEQEWVHVRTRPDLSDGRTYKKLRIDKPGNIGKESCVQFPGEADYRYLGLLKGAEGNTA